MKNISHISFSFWNSIGIQNSVYAVKRDEWLARKARMTIKDAHLTFWDIKEQLDYRKESSVLFSYKNLAKVFGISNPLAIQYAFEDMFQENPPTILKETVEAVKILKTKGVGVSIASNTNFISGKIVNRILDSAGLEFDFTVYSDEVGFNKPNEEFFSKVEEKAQVPVGLILHVGDDDFFDVFGAINYGFQSKLAKTAYDVSGVLMSLE